MAWSKESRHVRGYGSAWTKLRETIIARDYGLCQACKREGRLNPYRKGQGFAVDHIIPKAQGGTDDPANLMLLCQSHHSSKTEREAADAQGRTVKPTIGLDGWPTTEAPRFRTPYGLRKASIPVVLVCGPPGSGKTTWAKAQAQAGDTVVDLDDIKASVGGVLWDEDRDVFIRAARKRDDMLRALADQIDGRAFVVLMAIDPAERKHWADTLGAEVQLMTTPRDVCEQRVKADPRRRQAADGQFRAIDRWFRQNA